MTDLQALAQSAGWQIVEVRESGYLTIRHEGERFTLNTRRALTDRIVMQVAGYDEDTVRTFANESHEVTVSAELAPEKIIRELTRRILNNPEARAVATQTRELHESRMRDRQYLRDAIARFVALGFRCPDLRDGQDVPFYEYTSVKLYKPGCPSVTLYANARACIEVRGFTVPADKLVESMDALKAMSAECY